MAPILNGISKVVKKDVAIPPMLPNVEITAKPIGPQLHAPAAAPINEPITLPPIFLLEVRIILILKTFMATTSPDNAETITINEKANSFPCGMCPITYGSRKIYSEIIERGIKSPTNIATAKITYW